MVKSKADWTLRLLLWLVLQGCTDLKASKQTWPTGKTDTGTKTYTSNDTSTVLEKVGEKYMGTMTLVTMTCFQQDGVQDCRLSITWSLSQADRNKLTKIINGNISMNQNWTMIQWNMGGKYWLRKTHEIENVILKYKPDLFAISESNMGINLTDYEKNIAGYNTFIPKIAPGQNMSRLVLLVKDELQVQVLDHLMNNSAAAIWIKIGSRGRKPMLVGFFYREQQFLRLDQSDDSLTPAKQLHRLRMFIETWKQAAATGSDVLVLGDFNLDFSNWGQPKQSHTKMVDLIKNEIEILGFHQQTQGLTWSLNGQPESLIDHVWMNSPERLTYIKNIPRKFSDHNLIILSFRTKDKIKNNHDFLKRERKNFNLENYQLKMPQIDWREFYLAEDIDIMNSIFEKEVLNILDSEAPLKKFQSRTKYRKWVSEDVKALMSDRDKKWSEAKSSNRVEDWAAFKLLRNKCVKDLRKCKTEFFQKLYKQAEQEKTSRKLYNLTK